MRTLLSALTFGLAVAVASGAEAVCLYRGELGAKSTIDQEFSDARWVVKARVLSAEDRWSEEEDSWTTYDLLVVEAFKGAPPRRLKFFTFRNSGGFYMDRDGAGHDIGGEYLLFLEPWTTVRRTGLPAAARGAAFVTYSCGLSQRWTHVKSSSKLELRRRQTMR